MQRISLALLVGVLPIIAINGIYLLAATEGSVPWCVPYWDGCTSISATGRDGLAYFVFKAVMLPLGVLYLLYWRRTYFYLNSLGRRQPAVLLLGAAGAVAMMLYTLALGGLGDGFRLTRRIGIILFFTFTYLAQLLMVQALGKQRPPPAGWGWQLTLCMAMLLIGVLSLILGVVLPTYDDYEDSFEWVLALLLQLNFIGSHWTQRRVTR